MVLIQSLLSHTVINFARNFSSVAPYQRVLKIGEPLRETRIFTKEDLVEYSKVSHDANPLHFDSEFAQNAGFEDRVVYGMLVASLFPRIISSHFPGAIYVSQSLHFKVPAYIGEEVVCEVIATHIKQNKKRYITKMTTKCFKNGELLILDGEAMTLLPTLDMPKTQDVD